MSQFKKNKPKKKNLRPAMQFLTEIWPLIKMSGHPWFMLFMQPHNLVNISGKWALSNINIFYF